MGGPGSCLKRALARFGITPTPGCECLRWAAIMDACGPDWCEAHAELICGWLRSEAARRRLPFSATAARFLIRAAIRKARER